ncbi:MULTISPECIES: hypothetical protein [Haloferax]|uniref:Uncharacterized protein n=5 Tax=Haloferax TaxID=2251 RepID=A0A384KXG0_HALVD|nr:MULTISPECIES: hypothetical protein [Haloferax]ADE04210.1 uncharacterized protein HVO_2215 [Haloferax volcanii DS2]ELY33444.1 hypothetical protein C498_06368 [Haloferax volcanii DS2]ELZ55763.1 hypothetical protein C460_14865 [Haloferax sp. ATCC BAA-646]ELZ67282.1 hypothetical protein C459_02275 [Haloferax sp. ATCC BAA-645]ELZ68374.1 hypothetical protein C458_10181 [Haloferax sp. ATCC BAA-644]
MSPGLLITRFDATLLGMAVCLLAGAVAGVLSALPTALAAGGGATGAAALALGVTVSEL